MSNETLICVSENGGLNFGDYRLDSKTKVSGFEYNGDVYKVKSFKEITKLEKNDMFVYESVPGTAVSEFQGGDPVITFEVEGYEDTQIALEMEAEQKYEVFVDDMNYGAMTTNLGGKLVFSLDLGKDKKCVKIVRV